MQPFNQRKRTPMKKLTIAQIGVGNWGKNILRTFYNNPQISVKYICELNPDIRERLAGDYPDVKIENSYENVFQENSIDAVAIATPPITHYELAKQALLAGKHVFVEKPMTLEVAHSEELVALAKEKNRVVMVGHILEYHPAFVRLKEMVDAGELGDIYYIYSTRVNLGVIRKEENSLWSLAPHDISIVLMLMGQEPDRVTCTGQCYLQNEVEDVTFTSLHFPDDKMAQIHVSWLDPHKIRKVTVVGSKKMVVIDDMESTEKMRIYDKGVDFTSGIVSYHESITLRMGDIQIPNIKMQEPLKLEVQHFIDAAISGTTPKSDAVDGMNVVKILDAAQKSLKQNGAPVKI